MEERPQDPEFSLVHIGINTGAPEEAAALAELFAAAFGFPVRQGSSSYFAGSGIEIMKSRYLGKNGHIAIGTKDIEKAIAYLEARGFSMDRDTFKYSGGTLTAAYLKGDFGGFAVHLVKAAEPAGPSGT